MDYKEYEAGESTSNHFWHRAKKDLIFRMLSKLKREDLKILNLGAGTGEDLEILSKFGKVYVIDINKNALDLIPDDLCIEKKVCDAQSLTYPDGFFDVVTSFDVFEHIPDDNLAILEVKRVLIKGGYLFLSVPAFQSLYSAHDVALEHKRRYSRRTLKVLLSPFNSFEINYWNVFLFLPSALFRLLKKNAPPKVDSPHPLPLMDKLDSLLFMLLRAENILIERDFNLPFGLTLIGISRK